jgi:hypothetical protein
MGRNAEGERVVLRGEYFTVEAIFPLKIGLILSPLSICRYACTNESLQS